ncbi:MAG TPA: LacI family transcriptional regulator [Firmicutes bacterium]|jgi:LacI family transcriptional regulator|nr:LacI family transcriptional regulator [Bacillota bacterium]
MQQRVTMKTIAEEAGVSPATVSNVLNGKDKHVSQETIARITAIAARLGYQPLRNRAKSVRHLPCLGVITYNVTSPFFAAGLNGILTVADRLGFSVIVQSDFGREHQEINAAQMLIEQGVDGVVFLSSSAYSRDAAFKALVEAGIPIAVVNRLIDPDVAFHALIDNEQGGYIATQHLIELGHKNIGNIHMQANGPGATQAAADRLRGYYRALADYGLQPNPAWVSAGVGSDSATSHDVISHAIARRILSARSHPTALLCGTDYLAAGAMRAISGEGLRIPEDIAVVGCDNTVIAAYTAPTLTSIQLPLEQAAARAAEALIHAVWRGEKLHGVERFPCTLVVRDSTTIH